MKIIRWLLSHFFLILLVVVVIYGYMFWGNLAGEDTPAGKAIAYLSSEFDEVREFVEAVKAKNNIATTEAPVAQATAEAVEPVVNEPVASEAVAPEPAENVPAAEEPSGTEEAAPVVASDQAPGGNETAGARIEVPPASVSYQYREVQVMQDSSGHMEMKETVVADAAPAEDITTTAGNTGVPAGSGAEKPEDSFVPPETVAQLNNVNSKGQIIDPSRQSDELRKTWIAARKSFYRRDYKQSEENYQKIIDSTEDNFDAYGELGNVYFNQGKREQAAAAYFEAASILVRKGQVQRARSLTGLLRHLDRQKAVELQKLIESAAS